MLNTPFSPWPQYTEREIGSVQDILKSGKVNYWTGQQCREFEKEFAQFSDCEFAIAVANGTVALDLALRALGIGSGDEVVVTSRTFLATVSSIVLCGATPIFVDVDRDSQNIHAQSIAAAITDKTKAVLLVHLAGWPCEMNDILTLAQDHNLAVIEDCAQAHGAQYKGKSVGSFGDVGCWSFCQDKIISTGGEGGMVTTNRHELWQKMWSFKDHGKSWNAVYKSNHPPGFRWLHESFGTNWRMTEIQGAIGRIQLEYMANWHASRTKNSARLTAACESSDFLRVPRVPKHVIHAWYKFYAFVIPDRLPQNLNRDRIVEQINALGTPCYQGTCSEVYKERAFDNSDLRPKQPLAVARELGDTSLMFLVHPTLTTDEITRACHAIKQVCRRT